MIGYDLDTDDITQGECSGAGNKPMVRCLSHHYWKGQDCLFKDILNIYFCKLLHYVDMIKNHTDNKRNQGSSYFKHKYFLTCIILL